MDQSPLIDVDPEDSRKSTGSGCSGCFAKLLPLLVVLLVLTLLSMGAVYFFFGDDSTQATEIGPDGKPVATTAQPKTGFAGFMEKVSQTVKGKPDSGSNEATVSPSPPNSANSNTGGVPGVPGALGKGLKNLEDKTKLSEDFINQIADKEKAGQVAPRKIEPFIGKRGGAYGTSMGSAKPASASSPYHVWKGNFETSGSKLRFEVIYQEAAGQLQYRFFLMPYDAEAARLFKANRGNLYLSFHNSNGEVLLPAEGPIDIPLTKMTAYEAHGQVGGWVARDMAPLNGRSIAEFQTVRVAWDFDSELTDTLKEL